MSNYDAPIEHYDSESDTAYYNSTDIERLIDTGIFIECPECGESVTLDIAVREGCKFNCGRPPWNIMIEQP